MSGQLVNVYDFDHTIYDGDVSFDFILYGLKHNPRSWKYLPALGIALLKYALRLATRKQIKQAAFAFLRDTRDTSTLVQNFWQTHEKKIKSWYLDRKHPSDLIVSASPEFLLKPIAQKLHISSPLATIMDIHSGKIIGENCRAEEKVKRLYEYDPSIEIDNFFSDSLSDRPLLDLAKHAHIVKKNAIVTLHMHEENRNAKKALFRELVLYGIIGGATAALDVVLFKVFTTIGIPLLVANFLSVSTAVGSSFMLNAKYNFRKTDNIHKRGLKFFSIGYFGWLIQSVILLIGVTTLRFQELYVKIFAVIIAAAIQYLLNKFLTFKD